MSAIAFLPVGSPALVLQEVLCRYIVCTYHSLAVGLGDNEIYCARTDCHRSM